MVLGLIDRLTAASHGRARERVTRSEGAACVLLEAEETARARGARPIARIAAWKQATYAPEPGSIEDGGDAVAGAVTRALRDLQAPELPKIVAVVVALATSAIRDGLTAALGTFPALYELAPRTGYFESMGTLGIAAAARLLARGDAERWCGCPRDGAWGAVYAILLTRP